MPCSARPNYVVWGIEIMEKRWKLLWWFRVPYSHSWFGDPGLMLLNPKPSAPRAQLCICRGVVRKFLLKQRPLGIQSFAEGPEEVRTYCMAILEYVRALWQEGVAWQRGASLLGPLALRKLGSSSRPLTQDDPFGKHAEVRPIICFTSPSHAKSYFLEGILSPIPWASKAKSVYA